MDINRYTGEDPLKQQPLQMIRFPSITRLQYAGEEPNAAYLKQMRTRTNFNSKAATIYNSGNRSPTHFTLTESRREFKLVNLPPSADIMNICTMGLPDNKVSKTTLQPEEGDVDAEGRSKTSPLRPFLRKGKSVSTLTGINFKNK